MKPIHLYFRAVLPAATYQNAWMGLGGPKCGGAPQYFRVF